ncbi:MAG: hypothetical protein ACD_75C02418G0004 [uncultured bacterium]|nr:MAG: hypothetical protein ACD_75C02418G0004 [uncultured bacterium]
MDDVELLGINPDPHLPHAAPASGSPFPVIIGNRGLLLNDFGVRSEGVFLDRDFAEDFNDLLSALPIRGKKSQLLEFGEIVGKIGGCQFVAARIFQVQLAQAIDNKGRMGGFVNNREKLQERLFKSGEFFILIKKVWTGLHGCF